MQLTQRQEALITRHLRDVARDMDTNVPEKQRERALERLQRRIYRHLGALEQEVVGDADVLAVLDEMDLSQEEILPTADQAPVGPRAVWLGVCARLAERFGLHPWAVRAVALVLGITGPLVVIAYLIGFVELYLATDRAKRPRIAVFRVVFRPLAVFVAAMALHLATGYLIALIFRLHEEYLNRAIPVLGEWGWLQENEGDLLFWTLVAALPLAVLSGMPLANAWDHSLKRVTQAIVCLYGIALSFGIALILTGLIINVVQDFTAA